MTARRGVAIGAIVLVVVALGWVLFVGLPRWYGATATSQAVAAARATPATASASAGRHIKARLFYVAEDGGRLTAIERDVPYGESSTDQARQIVEAQIAPVSEPLVSAIPTGTKLRALYVTDSGEAYVDLTRDVAAAHSGGVTDELLTTYCIVNALTVNLPAITAVQILVEGREVETLAGHVDLRRPLAKNLSWIQ